MPTDSLVFEEAEGCPEAVLWGSGSTSLQSLETIRAILLRHFKTARYFWEIFVRNNECTFCEQLPPVVVKSSSERGDVPGAAGSGGPADLRAPSEILWRGAVPALGTAST